mgnify:CR=1 FL=1
MTFSWTLVSSGDLSLLRTSNEQSFELSLRLGDENYAYKLVIDHDPDRERMRIKEERLKHDNGTLFAFRGGKPSFTATITRLDRRIPSAGRNQDSVC